MARHRILHLVMTRQEADPSVVRWYVRYAWMVKGGAVQDRVLASGQELVGAMDAASVAEAVLEVALAELRRSRRTELS